MCDHMSRWNHPTHALRPFSTLLHRGWCFPLGAAWRSLPSLCLGKRVRDREALSQRLRPGGHPGHRGRDGRELEEGEGGSLPSRGAGSPRPERGPCRAAELGRAPAGLCPCRAGLWGVPVQGEVPGRAPGRALPGAECCGARSGRRERAPLLSKAGARSAAGAGWVVPTPPPCSPPLMPFLCRCAGVPAIVIHLPVPPAEGG